MENPSSRRSPVLLRLARSAAVVEAALLERQRLRLAFEMALVHLANDDAVIAEFMKADHLAFHCGRRVADNGCAVLPRLESVAAEFPVLGLDVLEECGADRLLSGAQHRQRENARLFDQRVRGRIGLNADYHERRLEARLREPVYGCDGLLVA